MDPHISQFITWAFQGLISVIAANASVEMRELRKSVQKLNEIMAAVLTKQDTHEKRLDSHDEDIKELRTKKRGA